MSKNISPELKALNKAIEKAGSQARLAEQIGCKWPSQVGVMVNRDKKASVKYVAKISEVTGVPCHELRPDIFPVPEPANDPTNQSETETA